MLIIFDCDGVLVDSEPLANQSFSRALKPHGLDWSVEETMRRLMGRSLRSCVEIVEAEIGRKLPDDFVEKMQEVTYRSLREAPLQQASKPEPVPQFATQATITEPTGFYLQLGAFSSREAAARPCVWPRAARSASGTTLRLWATRPIA